MAIAKHNWVTFDGWMKGVDAMELPLDRFLNAIHTFAIEGADEKDRDKFEVKLFMPPPGQKVAISDASPWSKENEESALSGLAAALGGGR